MRIIILIAITNVFFPCCRDSQKCPYAFYLPAELSPVQLEYHIGDTITVNSKFHKEVLGFNSEGGEVGFFNMEGIAWMPVTGIFRIDTDSGEDQSLISASFDFVENSNYNYMPQTISSGTLLFGDYNYENDSFRLSYSFIPRDIGVYLHEFVSFSGTADSQNFQGKCPGDFAIFMEVNKGMDNNISLLSESPNPHFNTWTLFKPKTRFYEMGSFAFKVIP